MQSISNEAVRHAKARNLRIGVLGMGHVGLPTALGLASLGWQVTGADSDPEKVAMIHRGIAPFHEPGLSEILSEHHKGERFTLTDDIGAAVRSTQVIFLCVGTPQKESGEADLSQVEDVARTIARNLNGYKLIVEKSTVPAITSTWIKRTIYRYARAGGPSNGSAETVARASASPRQEAAQPLIFDVASNPEFLQEGTAVQDFFRPHRVVCGVESERAREILQEIYRPFDCPVIMTDVRTAELIKHAANAFLATKISFINMVSNLCEAIGADVTDVARGIGLDPRIGSGFLKAGIGFGGYCLPKDLRAFIHLAEEFGVDFSLLKEVEHINQKRIEVFLAKVRQALWVVRGKTLAIFGLAFKPGTDDIREAPTLKIIEHLLREGAVLRLHDPKAIPNARRVFPEDPGRLTYCDSPNEAAQGADAVLLLTEWEEFRNLEWERIRDGMSFQLVIDGRNFLDPVLLKQMGFEYIRLGHLADAEQASPAKASAYKANVVGI